MCSLVHSCFITARDIFACTLQDIRYELLARLCPNSTGAEIRSVCTEAGMFAIRARRKVTHFVYIYGYQWKADKLTICSGAAQF
jgi:SpoVK/Ycf46/Vps4 family AAA+-type ATPase